MTEGEWRECKDLRAFPGIVWERATDRQVQLFAVACCRRIWHLLETRTRQVVEAAERFADDKATLEELYEARDVAREALDLGYRTLAPGIRKHVHTSHLRAAWDTAALCVCAVQREGEPRVEANRRDLLSIALCASTALAHATFLTQRKLVRDAGWDEIVRAETAIQTVLLRDVFGNPFRKPVVEPLDLLWSDGTAVKTARAIYNNRDFDDLPFLADALEDAGCAEDEILSHCRSRGPHTRGCWVLDLLREVTPSSP